MKQARLALLLFVLLFLVLPLFVQQGIAMPVKSHASITEKAIEIFKNLCDDCQEIQEPLDSSDCNQEPSCIIPVGTPPWEAPKSQPTDPAVVAGAIEEDGWHVVLPPGQTFDYDCDITIFLHHAWNPNTNRGWSIADQTSVLNDTGLEWANYYYLWALDQYWKDEKTRAYYLLGRAIHLLGDAATPAHAHGDPHLPILNEKDGYEDFLGSDRCPELCSASPGCGERLHYTEIRSFEQLQATFGDLGQELQENAANYFDLELGVPRAETLWELGPSVLNQPPPNQQSRVDIDLFHIFYYTAEHADDFPSDDALGEMDDWTLEGEEAYAEICEQMRPVAVQSTVALLELFWDRTHSVWPLAVPRVLQLHPGEQVSVYLGVQNIGSITWDAEAYVLENVGGYLLGAAPRQILMTDVPPGQIARWELPITAPSLLGMYSSEWQMKKDGLPFSPSLAFDLLVVPDSEEITNDLAAALAQWRDELLQYAEDQIDQYLEDLANRFEEWLQQESERLLSELLESLSQQCCGAAMIAPGFLLLVVWTSGRRRRKRMGDRDRE